MKRRFCVVMLLVAVFLTSASTAAFAADVSALIGSWRRYSAPHSTYMFYIFKADGTFNYLEGATYSYEGIMYGQEIWEGKYTASNNKLYLTEIIMNDRAVQDIVIEYLLGYDDEYKVPVIDIARLYETSYIDMEYAREFTKSE